MPLLHKSEQPPTHTNPVKIKTTKAFEIPYTQLIFDVGGFVHDVAPTIDPSLSITRQSAWL